MISVTKQNNKKLYELFFCDCDTSSYKTNVLKFVILVILLNKKCDINSGEKKKQKTKQNTGRWVKPWKKM